MSWTKFGERAFSNADPDPAAWNRLIETNYSPSTNATTHQETFKNIFI